MKFAKKGSRGVISPPGARCFLRLITILCALSVVSQTRQQPPVSQSELARQNMARVAASTGQLIAVLHRDPGLMVELKRWIAKDASDHGQLIADADLADQAIFERLEIDVTFRSIATALVQKYGYLQPTVNPESQLARQQELLMRERVKWVAQDEEAERARQRREQGLGLQQTQTCDSSNSNCANRSGTSPSIQPAPQDQPGMNQLPAQPPDLQPSPPYAPPQPSTPSNNGTQLLRTSSQDPRTTDETQSGSLFGGSPLSGQNFEAEGQTALGGSSVGGMQGHVAGTDGGGFSDLSLNAAFTGDPAIESANRTPAATNGIPGRDAAGGTGDQAPNNTASMRNLREARESSSLNQRMVRRPNPYQGIPSLYDMYLQASARPPAVERFGMQVFENGTRDLQTIPLDLPVGPEYVLGPGDGVSVDLWGGVSRRFYRVVDHEGRISLPEVLPVLVAGKSLAAVQESVQKTLRTQFRDVSADVSL